MAAEGPSWGGILLRVVVGLVLVFATFNPDGYSYFHWVIKPILKPDPAAAAAAGILASGAVKFIAGIVLLIGWVMLVQATRRSLGTVGIILVAALCAGLAWLLADLNLVTPRTPRGFAWIALVIVGVVLGLGMSWSHVQRRLTGQVDTDTVG